MIFYILAFFAGDLYLQTWSHLPTPTTISTLMIVGVLSFIGLKIRYPRMAFAAVFVVGFAWTAWHASSLLRWTLPSSLEGQPVLVTGDIVSLPIADRFQTNFEFSLDTLQDKHTLLHPAIRVRLSWRQSAMPVRVGEHWQFMVKLKRIHSTANPGGFDMEAWALQKGLRATGYVMPHRDNRLLTSRWCWYPIDTIRQYVLLHLKAILPHTSTAPWLLALTVGERAGIALGDWQVLRNTGTNHLMAIAGLHIGMMSGMVHLMASRAWRCFPRLMLRLPASLAGACAALLSAVLYSALAGFSLPTQRACMMLVVVIIALLYRRFINPWQAWSLALLSVLLINPLSVLTESFWLSFGTIALIIYGMSGRLAPQGIWWKWGRVQWVIGVGLVPLSLTLFQECSLISFAANSIAIPWLGFLILPFCLLSTLFLFISPWLAKICLIIADWSLSGLWMVLTWFSHLPVAIWHQAIPHMTLFITTTVGILLFLQPTGMSGRWFCVIFFLPLLLYQPNQPPAGDTWMTVLDVGQGLSVVVQTATHTLVYDVGPRMSANLDAGEQVVVPYLHQQGIKRIDMLVVSHGDNDHIGGAQALLRALPVDAIKTSAPTKLPLPQTDVCLAGDAWIWDNVQFSMVYPDKNALNLNNDSSCVLVIDNGEQRVMLPGDIEKQAEYALLNSTLRLSASVLVAPHHGSKTSGIKPFVSAVHPLYVVYATGYRNRYHFPHRSVIETYHQLGSIELNTMETGAITFQFKKNQRLVAPELYRLSHQRYWYERS